METRTSQPCKSFILLHSFQKNKYSLHWKKYQNVGKGKTLPHSRKNEISANHYLIIIILITGSGKNHQIVKTVKLLKSNTVFT